MAHRHTSSGNKCNAKRRSFIPPPLLTTHTHTHIIKLQHTPSVCHATRLVQTSSLCSSLWSRSSLKARARPGPLKDTRRSCQPLRSACRCRGSEGEVGSRSSVFWGRAIVCPPRKREKKKKKIDPSVPASRDYSKYVTNSLSLNAALSASGAWDSRREKTQVAFFFLYFPKKQNKNKTKWWACMKNWKSCSLRRALSGGHSGRQHEQTD